MSDQINVALVGLGFGAEFIPIYQEHPSASIAAICQRSDDSLNKIGDEFGIELSKRYTSYEELLEDPNIDAVRINTPIASHAPLSIQALKAGKHVACTVPMATSLDECREICELVEETGLTYMMMETVVYSREFLFVKELFEKGVSPKDIGILTRTKKELEQLQKYLMSHGFPVISHASSNFYQRREILDALSLLKFLINPWDDKNLLILLRSPWLAMSDAEIVKVLGEKKVFARKHTS